MVGWAAAPPRGSPGRWWGYQGPCLWGDRVRQYGGCHLYPCTTAYILGRGRHHRFPPPPQRHRLALLRHRSCSGTQFLTGGYAEYWLENKTGSKSFAETAAWFSSWGWILLVFPTSFILLLFPDGRLPSPRWRPVAWCAGLGIVGFVVSYATDAGPLEEFPQIVNPYGFDSPVLEVVGVAGALVAGGSMVASAISLIVRMRRAGSEQRQQIKWLAYGGAVVVGTIFVGGVISIWSGPISIAIIGVALLGVPVFTGIAIVRHRLYDIDVVINFTLVYAILSATLAVVYFGSIVLLSETSPASPARRSFHNSP